MRLPNRPADLLLTLTYLVLRLCIPRPTKIDSLSTDPALLWLKPATRPSRRREGDRQAKEREGCVTHVIKPVGKKTHRKEEHYTAPLSFVCLSPSRLLLGLVAGFNHSKAGSVDRQPIFDSLDCNNFPVVLISNAYTGTH